MITNVLSQLADDPNKFSNLVCVNVHLTAYDGVGVTRLKGIFIVYDTHFMRQEVSLLKSSDCNLPCIVGESRGKVNIEKLS